MATVRRIANAAAPSNPNATARRSSPSPPGSTRAPRRPGLRVEKRPKGKLVTAVRGLDPAGNDLAALAATLKRAIGGGGTVKDDGTIEVQGDHLDRVERLLGSIGYKTRRG